MLNTWLWLYWLLLWYAITLKSCYCKSFNNSEIIWRVQFDLSKNGQLGNLWMGKRLESAFYINIKLTICQKWQYIWGHLHVYYNKGTSSVKEHTLSCWTPGGNSNNLFEMPFVISDWNGIKVWLMELSIVHVLFMACYHDIIGCSCR